MIKFVARMAGILSGQQQITADKREIMDFPKLPSATSFIRKTVRCN